MYCLKTNTTNAERTPAHYEGRRVEYYRDEAGAAHREILNPGVWVEEVAVPPCHPECVARHEGHVAYLNKVGGYKGAMHDRIDHMLERSGI